jgi:hypothetical protein
MGNFCSALSLRAGLSGSSRGASEISSDLPSLPSHLFPNVRSFVRPEDRASFFALREEEVSTEEILEGLDQAGRVELLGKLVPEGDTKKRVKSLPLEEQFMAPESVISTEEILKGIDSSVGKREFLKQLVHVLSVAAHKTERDLGNWQREVDREIDPRHPRFSDDTVILLRKFAHARILQSMDPVYHGALLGLIRESPKVCSAMPFRELTRYGNEHTREMLSELFEKFARWRIIRNRPVAANKAELSLLALATLPFGWYAADVDLSSEAEDALRNYDGVETLLHRGASEGADQAMVEKFREFIRQRYFEEENTTIPLAEALRELQNEALEVAPYFLSPQDLD